MTLGETRRAGHLRLAARALRDSVRAAPGGYAALLVLTGITAAIPALQVKAVQQLTDAVAAGRGESALTWLAVLVALTLGVAEVAGDLRQALSLSTAWTVDTAATARVMQTVASFTPAQIADPEIAGLTKAGDTGSSKVSSQGGALLSLARSVVSLALLLVVLWPLSHLAAVLLLTALLLGMPGYWMVSRVRRRTWPKIIEQRRHASYYVQLLVRQQTASELVALGTGHRMAHLAVARERRAAALARAMTWQNFTWNVLSGVLTATLTGVALWVVATSGQAGPGGAAAGVVAILSGSSMMFGVAFAIGSLMADTAQLAAYYDLVAMGDGREPVQLEGRDVTEITCCGVGYTYAGGSARALTGIDLTLRKGEMVALVGLNGAGKTTLASCLAGLYEPTSGEVLVDGQPMTDLRAGQRLGAVALLTQEFGRYELTVRDAVGLGSPREDVTDDELWAALAVARADGFVWEMPDGLDAQLGQQWQGVGLSGGQWQRLALARIALRDAPVWILDEPTSAVDAVTEEEIFTDLGRSRADRITVVVSHRAWTLRSVDRIYVLVDGRVVETGSYPELMAAGGEFARMFRFQAASHEA